MPATFGVTQKFTLAPDNGYASEVSKTATVEVVTMRGEDGVTKKAVPKALSTESYTVTGKGTPDFSDVAVGSISEDTIFVTSVRLSETNEDFPSFTIEATKYVDL